jgi:ribonuclease P/MRP protein subunit POP5
MKTLPTLREKKRYIAFEIMAEQPITRSDMSLEVFNSICSLFGDTGASKINAALLSYDGKYGIVRCERDKTIDTRAALACIYSIRRSRVSILVLGISGTVKGAMEKFIQQSIINGSGTR